MKKKKVNALVKLILTTPFLFVLIIGNSSCGDDGDNPQPHIPSAHLDINSDGTYSCEHSTECTPKIWETSFGINVYRVKAEPQITDGQMTTAVANIEVGYESIGELDKPLLPEKLDKVYIIADQDWFFKDIDGKHVAGIKFDMETTNIELMFGAIATDALTPEP